MKRLLVWLKNKFSKTATAPGLPQASQPTQPNIVPSKTAKIPTIRRSSEIERPGSVVDVSGNVRHINFSSSRFKKFKTGDLVRLDTIPFWVKDLPKHEQKIFNHCLKKNFPVLEIDTTTGNLVLDVSVEVDKLFGGQFNDIRVEPQFCSLIEAL